MPIPKLYSPLTNPLAANRDINGIYFIRTANGFVLRRVTDDVNKDWIDLDLTDLETDPVFTASAASSITSTDITNWNNTHTNAVLTTGSYANPTWLTALDWSKITTTPTTVAGYGITDAVTTGGSYSNPSWLTSLAWSKITGTPTTLAGYGITDAVSSLTTASLTTTYLSKWDGSKLVNSLISESGGNVNINGAGTGSFVTYLKNTGANATGLKTVLSLPVFNGASGLAIESWGNSVDGYHGIFKGGQTSSELRFIAGNGTRDHDLLIRADGKIRISNVTNGTGNVLTRNSSTGEITDRTISQLAGDLVPTLNSSYIQNVNPHVSVTPQTADIYLNGAVRSNASILGTATKETVLYSPILSGAGTNAVNIEFTPNAGRIFTIEVTVFASWSSGQAFGKLTRRFTLQSTQSPLAIPNLQDEVVESFGYTGDGFVILPPEIDGTKFVIPVVTNRTSTSPIITVKIYDPGNTNPSWMFFPTIGTAYTRTMPSLTYKTIQKRLGVGLGYNVMPTDVLQVGVPIGTVGDISPIITARSSSHSSYGGLYHKYEIAAPYASGLVLRTYKQNVGLFNAIEIANSGNTSINGSLTVATVANATGDFVTRDSSTGLLGVRTTSQLASDLAPSLNTTFWSKDYIFFNNTNAAYDMNLITSGSAGSVGSNAHATNAPISGSRFMVKMENLNGTNGIQWAYDLKQTTDNESEVWFRKYRSSTFGNWNKIWHTGNLTNDLVTQFTFAFPRLTDAFAGNSYAVLNTDLNTYYSGYGYANGGTPNSPQAGAFISVSGPSYGFQLHGRNGVLRSRYLEAGTWGQWYKHWHDGDWATLGNATGDVVTISGGVPAKRTISQLAGDLLSTLNNTYITRTVGIVQNDASVASNFPNYNIDYFQHGTTGTNFPIAGSSGVTYTLSAASPERALTFWKQANGTKELWFRGYTSGNVPSLWRKIWTDSDFDIANYLPLTGGTLTGTLILNNSNYDASAIKFKNTANGNTDNFRIGHRVLGTTNSYFGFSVNDGAYASDILRLDKGGVSNATGDFVTIDGSNYLRRRTGSQALADMGGLDVTTAASTYMLKSYVNNWQAAVTGIPRFVGAGGTTSPDGSAYYMGITIPHATLAGYAGNLALRNGNLQIQTQENSVWGSWYQVWHSGNFTPSNYLTSASAASTYLPLAGGTISGNLLVSGTTDFGISNSYTLQDGAGNTFIPQVRHNVSTGVAAIAVGVSGGGNNKRVGLFMDEVNSAFGLTYLYSSGASEFQIRTPGSVPMRISVSGISNATGDFVTIDGSNYLRRRTSSQALADMGITSTMITNWESAYTNFFGSSSNSGNALSNNNPDLNTIIARATAYFATSTTPNRPSGFTSGAIINLGRAAGVNSMQLAIEANQDDVFLYRNQTTNNWFRVASREWSNSAFAPITHSHAISDVTGLQTALDGKQAALSGTGFVKISGTTITYDNSTYLTTSSAASTYQSILVSGTNIKTINSTSLLGSGNVSVGTVTSVGLSVPTGLNISGSPVTSSGTLAVSFASGYSIPTTAKQTQWDAAYTYSGVGHIPLAGTNSLAGNIIPVTGNTYDLGSSTNRFSNIYARFFYQEGNLVATQSWVTSQNYLTTVGTSNIQNSAVTLPKIQNIASKTVLANITSSAAAPDEVLISTIKEEMGDAEGTYVPSFTNVSNASSFSPDGDAMWTKSGDIVTVYGVVEQEATAAGIVQFTISLPIASDLDGSSQLVGQFISDVTASGKSYTAPIKAEITSNKALVSFDSEREVSVLHYHFRYIVQ